MSNSNSNKNTSISGESAIKYLVVFNLERVTYQGELVTYKGDI